MGAVGRRQSGVSLVEALVALAVIGFGLVAYVGLQSTLSQSGDIARQRAEAVRLTQEAIESARAFTLLTPTNPPDEQTTFAGIATTETPESMAGINATYALRRTVIDLPDRNMKALMVETTWRDRNDDLQAARFGTVIAAISPELAGSLAVPGGGNPQRLPGGRHPAIPIEAVDRGDGFSRFEPPGSTVTWFFDNRSGIITSLCSTTDSCIATNALLLSGYVRFALSLSPPPGPADAEVPPDPTQPLSVVVRRTYPSAADLPCLVQQRFTDVRYWCAVPVNTDGKPPRWAGRSELEIDLDGLEGSDLAADRSDAASNEFRVCRYTPYRDHRAVGEGNPPMRNADHPLDYGGDQPGRPEQGVDGPLTNQNFLVIAAGDGAQPFDCPDDDTSTPSVNGRTWHHQPAE